MAGAWITIVGAVLTIIINYLFIPRYGYMACAWATFACYGSMMVISFIWGQKEYSVPYAWKKLLAYMVIVVLLYFAHRGLLQISTNRWYNLGTGVALLLFFTMFVMIVERKELGRLPVIGKFFLKTA